jgi:hypothetical protein
MRWEESGIQGGAFNVRVMKYFKKYAIFIKVHFIRMSDINTAIV